MRSLEAFERDARALQEAVGNGSTRAALRVLRVLPNAAPGHRELGGVTLADARHVVAREAGLGDWNGLLRACDIAAHSTEEAQSVLVDAEAMLVESTINAPIPPRGWPPLLYVCHSRHAAPDARRRLASALLDLGADPNVGTPESDSSAVSERPSALPSAMRVTRRLPGCFSKPGPTSPTGQRSTKVPRCGKPCAYGTRRACKRCWTVNRRSGTSATPSPMLSNTTTWT